MELVVDVHPIVAAVSVDDDAVSSAAGTVSSVSSFTTSRTYTVPSLA